VAASRPTMLLVHSEATMDSLDPAQKKWLRDLAGLVGGVVEAATPSRADAAAGSGAAGKQHDPRFAPLLAAAEKLDATLQSARDRLADQVAINKDQRAIASASQAAGTVGRFFSSAAHKVGHAFSDAVPEEAFHAVTTPGEEAFEPAVAAHARFQSAAAQGDWQACGEALKAYAQAVASAKARVDDFLQGIGSGAEGATTVLKGTAIAGAVAATVATGGIASGAALPTLGVAASSGASLLGTATAVGTVAGGYGATQELAGQATERAIGTRGEIDLGQIALRGAKDAAIGFAGAFLGGVLAKQFAKMFGSYLSTAISAEELAAIGTITNNGVPLARDAFLSTGQRLVTDFLAGAGTTPVTTAIAVVTERIAGKPLPTTEQFGNLVLEELIRGGVLQLFIGAITHGGGKPAAHEEGTLKPLTRTDEAGAIPDWQEQYVHDMLDEAEAGNLLDRLLPRSARLAKPDRAAVGRELRSQLQGMSDDEATALFSSWEKTLEVAGEHAQATDHTGSASRSPSAEAELAAAPHLKSGPAKASGPTDAQDVTALEKSQQADLAEGDPGHGPVSKSDARVLDLPEYQEGVERASRAFRRLVDLEQKKTTAAPLHGDTSESGWGGGKAEAAERAKALGIEAGHETEPHFRDQGDEGRYESSHAERQAAQGSGDQSFGVSKELCAACQRWFKDFAKTRRLPYFLADPKGTLIFLPDGRVIREPHR